MREICQGSDYRQQGVNFFYQNWVDVILGFQKKWRLMLNTKIINRWGIFVSKGGCQDLDNFTFYQMRLMVSSFHVRSEQAIDTVDYHK